MRTITALLASVLVAATATASPTAAAPDSPGIETAQRAKITLSASPEYVRKGGIVTLTGKVTGGRTTVTIFQKNKGARRWVIEAVKKTNRKGRFTHREDVNTGDRTYKACAKGRCASVYVHMGKKPKPPKPEPAATAVSISALSATQVEAGQAFTVVGTATPNLNGRTVSVEAYDAGSSAWTAVSTATVQNGAWSAPTAISTAGKAISVRASFTGGIGLKPSTSTASSIAVYGWYYFEDMSTVESYWDYEGSQRISGVTYPKSVSQDSRYVAVDLQRACIRFTAVVGLDDSSSSGSRSSIRLLADSVEKYANTNLTLGVGYPVDLDITGALRFNFQPTPVTNSPQVVLGDARVLCAF